MKKIFISLPMNGKSEEEIKKEMDRIYKKYINFTQEENSEMVNTYIESEPNENVKNAGVWYLGTSVQLLSQADVIVMGNGWEDARGCKLELEIAQYYGIIYLDERQF